MYTAAKCPAVDATFCCMILEYCTDIVLPTGPRIPPFYFFMTASGSFASKELRLNFGWVFFTGGASNEDEASSSTSSDSGSDTESSSSEDAAAHKRMAVQRQSSMALWLSHAPVGMRPISAGASRKRAASNTPGSDQVEKNPRLARLS